MAVITGLPGTSYGVTKHPKIVLSFLSARIEIYIVNPLKSILALPW